jgi:hypothetical protein
MPRYLSAFAATSLLCLGGAGSGCGGSGGPPPPVTVTLLSDAGLDGTAGTSNFFSAASQPTAGDNGAQAFRGFYSFDLALPPGAVVLAATVRIAQYGGVGAPYSDHGVVLLEHVDYGASLDAADFGTAALGPSLGTLASDATPGYTALDATAQVQADRAAGRIRSQFRLRFSLLDTDGDGTADQAWFNDREDNGAVGTLPQLVVTYQP